MRFAMEMKELPCPPYLGKDRFLVFKLLTGHLCLQDSAMGVGSTGESVLPGYVSVLVASRRVLVAPSCCSDTGSHHRVASRHSLQNKRRSWSSDITIIKVLQVLSEPGPMFPTDYAKVAV
jgi:hypothetical protein